MALMQIYPLRRCYDDAVALSSPGTNMAPNVSISHDKTAVICISTSPKKEQTKEMIEARRVISYTTKSSYYTVWRNTASCNGLMSSQILTEKKHEQVSVRATK